jgi:lysophospholipase L1-like esterase
MRGLLVLGGTLMGLLLCELVARLAGSALPTSVSTRALQEEHPIYGVFHRPGVAAWVHDREFTTYVRFNRAGLRGAEVGPHTDGLQRVLVLGDSFVEGAEVDEADTVSAVTARRLTDAGIPAEVLNAGVRGWGTGQEYLYLTHEGLQLHPDIVVLVFYVGNDLIDNSAELTRGAPDGSPVRPFFSLVGNRLELTPVPHHPGFGQQTWLQIESDRSALITFIVDDVVVHAQYADASENLRKTDRQVFAEPPPPAFKRSWAVTDALLLAMRDATDAAGARFLLVIAPHKAQLDPAELDRVVKGGLPSGVTSWSPSLPTDRLDALASAQSIEVVDLLPPFRAAWETEPLYFAENSHWTAAGHRVAAEAIADALQSR